MGEPAPGVDHGYMARALRLAQRGLYTTDPNPRVGCVLVRGDSVVGEGWHAWAGEPHAEVMALSAAGDRATGATAYVTLEPCAHHGRTPPCTQALIQAGVTRVVAAMLDPNPLVAGTGLAELEAAGMTTDVGVAKSEAQALNPGFVRRMTAGRPAVRVKLAASLDGRTALANGVSQWVTGASARQDVQHWRARSSAIITGVGTVLADDPRLTVRLPDVPCRSPLRVILDSQLRTPPTARVLSQTGETVIMTTAKGAQTQALVAAGAHVVTLPAGAGGVALKAVMTWLTERGVNELQVEAGPTLNGALWQAGLVDELVLYTAPVLLGDAGQGMFQLPCWQGLAQCPRLEIVDMRALGEDWRVIARPAGQ